MRLKPCHSPGGSVWGYSFWCPGCQAIHMFVVSEESGVRWTFNGNLDKPSFSPSLLVNADRKCPEYGRCHLFLTDGMLRFCGDCDHDLKGQIVPLPELPEDWQ